ncbi:MAG: bacteriorhodopsin [Acidobacteriota bacterium]
MDTLALVTQYSFWLSFLCLSAGAFYFIVERDSLGPEFRSTSTLAAIICGIAAANYFYMLRIVGIDGTIDTVLGFPTEFRYLDWLITTPLILTKFPALLGFDEDRKPLLVTLIFADVVMIATGYAGEVAINQAGGKLSTLGIWMFIASMLAWMFIIYILYTVVSNAATDKLRPIREGLTRLRLFIVIGWAIYPIGYFVSMLGVGAEGQLVRELIYNIADVVNKVGFGLVAFFAVRQVTREQSLRQAFEKL